MFKYYDSPSPKVEEKKRKRKVATWQTGLNSLDCIYGTVKVQPWAAGLFATLCNQLFCILCRSTTHLPLWLRMTSYFTRSECESLTVQWHSTARFTLTICSYLVAANSLTATVTGQPFCCFCPVIFATRWTPPDRCVRSRMRGRWPTWTKASSTLWRSTNWAPTTVFVTPSVKFGWVGC